MLISHIAALRRYAVALLGNSMDADDLVQECLIRAMARTKPWGDVKNVRAYLFTILHNVHVDRLMERRRNGNTVPVENVESQLSGHPPQDGKLALNELQRALYELPGEQRQVVLLIGLEGMSYREAATVLSVPVGTVMSRLSRGRETLRRLLAGGSVAELHVVN